jgi:hypothetical protein
MCATAFGVLTNKEHYNPAAVVEWAVAFVFTFYILSFVIDLAPAVKTRHARFGDETQLEKEANDTASESHRNYVNGDAGQQTGQQYYGDGSRTAANPALNAHAGRHAHVVPAQGNTGYYTNGTTHANGPAAGYGNGAAHTAPYPTAPAAATMPNGPRYSAYPGPAAGATAPARNF